MRYTIKNVIDSISEKLSIPKSLIGIDAYFREIDIDVGKGCSKSEARSTFCTYYDSAIYGGLRVSICVEDIDVFTFEIEDVVPNWSLANKMNVSYGCYCAGPGFYSYCPYLEINEKCCNKEDVNSFINEISFNPKKTRILILPKDFNEENYEDKKQLLKKYNFDIINKDFLVNFKDNLVINKYNTNINMFIGVDKENSSVKVLPYIFNERRDGIEILSDGKTISEPKGSYYAEIERRYNVQMFHEINLSSIIPEEIEYIDENQLRIITQRISDTYKDILAISNENSENNTIDKEA